MKRLSYAMVGGAAASFIGPIHRMAIRMDNLADLAAGAFSRDPAANAATGAECGVAPERVYADWRQLIAAEAGKIDFLAVCTPNDSHYEIAKTALEAGIDVFCEKPLSLTLAEAAELGRIAAAKGLYLAIPFTYSGFPMVKLARDLVAKGELGEVCKVVLEYQQGSFRKIDFTKPLDKRNAWKMDPAKSGRSCVVADIGVHAFHLIEYVTGLETKAILADLSSYAPGNALDDDASILFRLSPPQRTNGRFIEAALPDAPTSQTSQTFQTFPKASLVTSKIATGEENGVRLRVYGDKASLYWNQESPNYLSVKYPWEPERIYKRKAPYIDAASESSVRASRIPAGHHEGFIEGFANIYDEFCASVRDRRPHDFPGPREGARTMRFVEAALESNAKGNVWVEI